ncbi:MAG TPA: hypothetical protein VNK48_15170 [Xanthobacteraceae bacterium]|nr:hypothetical protein [Xanthobacteraceae bacterium]
MSRPVPSVGSLAANIHEGFRSEYLAQFVFSAFGTAIPVPHQEDTGLDLYCTLLERVGQRAWPRAYYSVQVKSTMEPWIIDGPESVRWLIEHPLPIFLCVVNKQDATIRVYHTTPRFAAWAWGTHKTRLQLDLGNENRAQTVDWRTGDSFILGAPILKFTVQQILGDDFRKLAADVLQFWIDNDVENLFRIKSGIPAFLIPNDYETNTKNITSWTIQSGRFRDVSLATAERRLKELLGFIATHRYENDDIGTAAIYAMALRQLAPGHETFTEHNFFLLHRLNQLFPTGSQDQDYVFRACDALLKMVREHIEAAIANSLHTP